MPARTAAALADHLGYWLRYVSNHVSHGFARRLEGEGVTVAEWVILRELFDTGAMRPSLLAERLGLTRERVRQIQNVAIEKLRDMMDYNDRVTSPEEVEV